MQEGAAQFDANHFPGGVNHNFKTMSDKELEGKFGGCDGVFHNVEKRDIAKNFAALMRALASQCGYSTLKGKTVIDIGCGTGLFSFALAEAVGESGRVWGTDVSEGFVSLCNKKKQSDMNNISFVLTSDKALDGIPTACCDMVLLCDVYHHLEYPTTFMSDVRRVCKPTSVVVLVDFHRDPTKIFSHPENPNWALEHLRADQATFEREIASAGFIKSHEVSVENLRENYVVVFTCNPHVNVAQ